MIVDFLNIQLTNNPPNLTFHSTINILISKTWIKYLFATHITILRLEYQLIQNLFQAICQTLAKILYTLPTKLIGLKSQILEVSFFLGIKAMKVALRDFSNLLYW